MAARKRRVGKRRAPADAAPPLDLSSPDVQAHLLEGARAIFRVLSAKYPDRVVTPEENAADNVAVMLKEARERSGIPVDADELRSGRFKLRRTKAGDVDVAYSPDTVRSAASDHFFFDHPLSPMSGKDLLAVAREKNLTYEEASKRTGDAMGAFAEATSSEFGRVFAENVLQCIVDSFAKAIENVKRADAASGSPTPWKSTLVMSFDGLTSPRDTTTAGRRNESLSLYLRFLAKKHREQDAGRSTGARKRAIDELLAELQSAQPGFTLLSLEKALERGQQVATTLVDSTNRQR